jgi:succinoglycan biosynthesis transport protein ExoP
MKTQNGDPGQHEKLGLNGPAVAPRPIGLPPKDYLDLQRIFRSIVRERWLILTSILLVLFGAVTYVIATPPDYSATAQVLMDNQKPKIMRGEPVVADLDTSRFLVGPVIDSAVEIFRSPPLVGRVIKELKLVNDPYFAPGFLSQVRGVVMALIPQAWLPPKEAANYDPDVPPELVEKFLTLLDVRRKGLTLILNVTFTHGNPARAALIANTLVTAFLDDQRQTKVAGTRHAIEMLQKRLAELRKEVVGADLRVQDYRKEHALVAVGGVAADEREMSDLLVQLASARTDAANKMAEKDEVERLLAHPNATASLARVLKSELIARLRQQEAEVLRRLAILTAQFGPMNGDVQRTQAEIRDLRDQTRQEIARVIQSATYESTVADARVKMLEVKLTGLKNDIANNNRLNVKLLELERQAKVTSNLFVTMLARLEDAQAQESMISADSRVVAHASPPPLPSAPRKAMILALALMGSVGLGTMLVLLKDHMSDVIRNPDEIVSTLQIPLIASVPRSKTKGPGILREVLSNRSSAFSQAIFALKRRVSKDSNRAQTRVVGVVSAIPGEGKTAIASNLAHYAAVSGVKTLLIDCNLRNPKLTTHLSPSAQHTLVDMLEGKADGGEVITRDGESGLYFCPAPVGRDPLLPMEVLASPELSDFLDAARRSYDLIILDTSPLLPVVDSRALIDLVDVGILVVECGRLTMENAMELMTVVPALAEKMAGVVLNKTAERRYGLTSPQARLAPRLISRT